MIVPVFPVVILQADTASVAARSLSAPVVVLGGVCMYHCPVATPGVATNSGSSGSDMG